MSVSEETPRRRGRPPVIAVPEEGARVIKKYGNRRLYDTRESCYVNQEALLDLFAADDGLRVLDASSGEDLTERVLAQAILGEDSKREKPLVPVAVLRALARFRGRERAALARHLTESVAGFVATATRGKGKPAASNGARKPAPAARKPVIATARKTAAVRKPVAAARKPVAKVKRAPAVRANAAGKRKRG